MKTTKATEKYDYNHDGEIDHADADFVIHDINHDHLNGADLLALQKQGVPVTAQDFIDLRKNGGAVTAADLVAFSRKGGKLTSEDVINLAANGVVLTGDDLVTLAKKGVKFSPEDIKRFQGDEFHMSFSDKNVAYFENHGVDVDTPSTIPDNATWDDIQGMLDAGVKLDAKDIMDWAHKHPDRTDGMVMAFVKDRGLGEHNQGQIVEWLVDKGAKITKSDIFDMQRDYHCFSGKEIAYITEHSKIKFTADDLLHLKNDLQCGFDDDTIKRITKNDKITLDPTQYKTLVG